MPFSDLSTKVEDHAASAIAVMKDRGIRPHPINYTLWYAYFADHCPPLTRELNERLVEDQPFTESYGLEAFERYFGLDREGEQIVETSERVQEALGRVLKALTEGGTANSGHGDAIEALSKDLATVESGGDKVGALVQAVLTETRKLVANTRAMERRLDASAREVETLRRNLESVRRESLTDPLTGLANRKRFELGLRRQIFRSERSGETLSLLLLDIDRFRAFNESFGQPVGDQLLRLVGRTLQARIKDPNLAARYGGEEFGIVLPKTALDDAVAVAESLRRAVEKKRLVHRTTGREYGSITISIGAAGYRAAEPPEALVRRAGSALARAKRDGRNRVMAETPGDSASAA